MTRREILVELLRRYREAQETLTQSDGTGGGGVTLMPRTWNPSFRELERCLHVLSGERPKQTRMLLARYVDPTISRKTLVGRREIRAGGREAMTWLNMPPHSEVVTFAKLPEHKSTSVYSCVLASWPAWVRASLVESALQRLEAVFVGDPWLPVEMLEVAA